MADRNWLQTGWAWTTDVLLWPVLRLHNTASVIVHRGWVRYKEDGTSVNWAETISFLPVRTTVALYSITLMLSDVILGVVGWVMFGVGYVFALPLVTYRWVQAKREEKSVNPTGSQEPVTA